MTASEFLLAVMSASNGAAYSPVKIQKLFFLLEKKLGKKIGGPFFKFEPYHYGPFAKNLYKVINELHEERLVDINTATLNSPRLFRLTPTGQKNGERILKTVGKGELSIIRDLDTFVRKQNFRDLVSHIYKEYPDMQVNSIFEKKI